ncbi:MAG: DEAD/DEAH box helicase [Archangium gephyra]|uniref:DEAD/DEAH box helicase n=1 Tax=Archangium gephyra TaxID=48 RepID=A0A2W5TI16_9BACT|nr:MAG: DEAD/DEAH box helicase [Archangium gephyra]
MHTSFNKPRSTPWEHTNGVDQILEQWRGDRRTWSNVVLDELLEGTTAKTAPIPEHMNDKLRAALNARGMSSLYTHQAKAFELATSGRDFVVATPTASGKSLCYVLPVLQSIAADKDARALFLFPTKALSRDQEESLRGLMKEAGIDQGAITFDGDTPGDARRLAREKSSIILSNPDMIHAGVLPHHANWARFFAGLKYVVIDELHAYRGVFGSHLANVLRRLDRVARFHGGKPQYLMASATIGNPQEHATKMLGREVDFIGESGAPRGDRRVVLYNPPVLNPELGVRESYVKASARLTADLVKAGVPTLLFGQSRNNVEVMLTYVRDAMQKSRMNPELVQAYRAGYLPQQRRDIEARLRSGDVKCVVATSALELGIDVGSLDAVVCAGWPGSVAALWQRFGRAGRRQGTSLSLLVTSSLPVDQYVASTAKNLLAAPIEQARIDPDNVEVLVQHLKCAAFELPFEGDEGFRDVAPAQVKEVLEYLGSHQVLHATTTPAGRSTYHWSTDAYPANDVSLRSVGWDNVVVVDLSTDKTIAEMDWRSTHTMLHEQAIYQHDGRQFQVEKLDLENHKAFVRPVEPDYFTDAMTYTKVTVLSRASDETKPAFEVGAGEVSVVERVVGYKKIKFFTHENVGYGDVRLPEMQMHTTAFWLTVPENVMLRLVADGVGKRPDLLDALNGVLAAMHTVGSVGLMIDPRDLGHVVGSRDGSGSQEAIYEPTLFLYDHVPGGVGLASRLFDEREQLLRDTRELLERCECQQGCPACVGPVLTPGRKSLAIALLDALGVSRAS